MVIMKHLFWNFPCLFSCLRCSLVQLEIASSSVVLKSPVPPGPSEVALEADEVSSAGSSGRQSAQFLSNSRPSSTNFFASAVTGRRESPLVARSAASSSLGSGKCLLVWLCLWCTCIPNLSGGDISSEDNEDPILREIHRLYY